MLNLAGPITFSTHRPSTLHLPPSILRILCEWVERGGGVESLRCRAWEGGRWKGWRLWSWGWRVEGGRVEGWKGGRVEGWRVGRVEGWKGGRVEGWKGGRVEGWKGGRVEGWKGGRVEGGGWRGVRHKAVWGEELEKRAAYAYLPGCLKILAGLPEGCRR